MSRQSFVGVAARFTALAFSIGAAAVALPSLAASGDYPFWVRGIVESVDVKNAKIVVTGTTVSTAATADLQSKQVEYSLKNAQVFRWENGHKVPRSRGYLKAGQEVVMKGNKKSGSFIVDWVVINDRTFDVTGRVKDYNTDENWIKVLVGRSTLQHKGYVNTQVKFYYNDDTTKCYRLGTKIDCSEITNENQGIRLVGERSSTGGKWEVTKVWNRYHI